MGGRRERYKPLQSVVLRGEILIHTQETNLQTLEMLERGKNTRVCCLRYLIPFLNFGYTVVLFNSLFLNLNTGEKKKGQNAITSSEM